ncbi:hypothetical protein ACH49O_41905 [Streptomyces coeruleorubidus]|uniref:hypothetical protein n=1 Tax=Streptomyces coeruleorubidus TaxID=116188 RepID=UPI00379792A8
MPLVFDVICGTPPYGIACLTRGVLRRRPDVLLADRGYDHDKYRRLLWKRGIRPVIAERGQPHGSGLGNFGWVVERTITWLHSFRRLRF